MNVDYKSQLHDSQVVASSNFQCAWPQWPELGSPLELEGRRRRRWSWCCPSRTERTCPCPDQKNTSEIRSKSSTTHGASKAEYLHKQNTTTVAGQIDSCSLWHADLAVELAAASARNPEAAQVGIVGRRKKKGKCAYLVGAAPVDPEAAGAALPLCSWYGFAAAAAGEGFCACVPCAWISSDQAHLFPNTKTQTGKKKPKAHIQIEHLSKLQWKFPYVGLCPDIHVRLLAALCLRIRPGNPTFHIVTIA
jgi:hypothetical protein